MTIHSSLKSSSRGFEEPAIIGAIISKTLHKMREQNTFIQDLTKPNKPRRNVFHQFYNRKASKNPPTRSTAF